MNASTAPLIVNLWDDYVDDGESAVPQRTFAFVEDEATDEEQKRVLQQLEPQFQAWAQSHGEVFKTRLEFQSHFKIERWELQFEGLTHRVREAMVEDLQGDQLEAGGRRIGLISES